MTRKRTSVQERRQALVDAARRVMSRDGIAAATTRAICAEAGMPNGFFHYCFQSKQELMLEVLDAFVGEANEVMLVRLKKGNLREVLRECLTAYLDDLFGDPSGYQLIYELTLYLERNPEYAEMARDEYLGYVNVSVEFLMRAASVSGTTWIVPVSELGMNLSIVVDGVTMEWLALRDNERARRHFELLGDRLMESATERPAAATDVSGRASVTARQL